VVGSSPDRVYLERLWAIGTLPQCPRSYLFVAPGDRIAVAWGYPRADGVRGPVSAVAVVAGRLDPSRMPGLEQLTVAQVRAAVNLPPTDAVASGPTSGPSLPIGAIGTVLASILGGLCLLRRLKLRRGSTGPP